MSFDPIVKAVNEDPEYITALADFFSKHAHTLKQLLDFDKGLCHTVNTDEAIAEA